MACTQQKRLSSGRFHKAQTLGERRGGAASSIMDSLGSVHGVHGVVSLSCECGSAQLFLTAWGLACGLSGQRIRELHGRCEPCRRNYMCAHIIDQLLFFLSVSHCESSIQSNPAEFRLHSGTSEDVVTIHAEKPTSSTMESNTKHRGGGGGGAG